MMSSWPTEQSRREGRESERRVRSCELAEDDSRNSSLTIDIHHDLDKLNSRRSGGYSFGSISRIDLACFGVHEEEGSEKGRKSSISDTSSCQETRGTKTHVQSVT